MPASTEARSGTGKNGATMVPIADMFSIDTTKSLPAWPCSRDPF